MNLKEYEKLSPELKGFASYMYGAIPGMDIPDKNPYCPDAHPHEHAEFEQGQFKGALEAQEADD